MARTHGRIKVEVWEQGSDYRQLTVQAQWVYQMLVSQPQVTMCGTLPYIPKKWAKLASGLTIEQLEAAIAELEHAWYVIVDRDTDELLIRTFVKHDRPWTLPNLVASARRQYREIDSHVIRDYLVERHPWIEDTTVSDAKVRAYEQAREHEAPSERTLALPLDTAQDLAPVDASPALAMDMGDAHSNAHGQRASVMPMGDAHSNARPRTRARVRDAYTRTAPGPSPTPGPQVSSDSTGVGRARDADSTYPPAEALPEHLERQVQKLSAWIGNDADDQTLNVLRRTAATLPEGSLAKVVESCQAADPTDRAQYAVGALRSEHAELAARVTANR